MAAAGYRDLDLGSRRALELLLKLARADVQHFLAVNREQVIAFYDAGESRRALRRDPDDLHPPCPAVRECADARLADRLVLESACHILEPDPPPLVIDDDVEVLQEPEADGAVSLGRA